MEQRSLVSLVDRLRARPVSDSSQRQILLFAATVEALRCAQLLSIAHRGIFPQGQAAGALSWSLTPSSAEVNTSLFSAA